MFCLFPINSLFLHRQVIESEIKAINPDMKPIFFDALNKEGSIAEQNISAESLGRAFGPLQKQVKIVLWAHFDSWRHIRRRAHLDSKHFSLRTFVQWNISS